ncbi:MAG: glycosyltransferase [Ignavibacteriales bacterium]|nr:glycosyltransferase [Ignavibacteriales bacterium]
MNILSICPILPYPLIDGGRRNVFFPLKHLTNRGHRIQLACLTVDNNAGARRALEQYFEIHVVVHPAKKALMAGAFRSVFRTIPYVLSRNHSELLLSAVFKAAEQGVDLVQIEGIHAAWYGLEVKKWFGIPVILRLHNLESSNLRTYVPFHPNPLARSFLKLELRKLIDYERSVFGLFDRVLPVSHDDEQDLLMIAPGARTVVIPVGVDTDYFRPVPTQEDPGSILWLGSLQWLPNRDSLFWFYREILPILVKALPSVIVRVAGSVSADVRKKFVHPNLTFLGEVDDIRPLAAASQVCVVPLRAGSGIRMKILEFFAMGKAVVSTTVGAKGLDVAPGVHLLCADDPSAFADRVIHLLKVPGDRARYGKAGRNLVESRYSWDTVTDGFERVYEKLGSS